MKKHVHYLTAVSAIEQKLHFPCTFFSACNVLGSVLMLLSEILVDRGCSSGCAVIRSFNYGFMNPQHIFSGNIDSNVRVGSSFPVQSCCIYFFSLVLSNNITVLLLCRSSLLHGFSVRVVQ